MTILDTISEQNLIKKVDGAVSNNLC